MSPAWWAFGVSAVSLLVAGTSLGWQIASFLLAGVRVRVDAGRGHVVDVVEPFDAITGRARNVGRQPVSVEGVWLQPLNRKTFLWPTTLHPLNPRLPYTLHPGHSFSFVFPIENLREDLRKDGIGQEEFKVGFSFGNGKSFVSEQSIDVVA